MGGKYINKAQAELYMSYRADKKMSQASAAAKADISVRSARDIEHYKHHTSKPLIGRNYKTRASPIDKVWEAELEPMLRQNSYLQAKTLLIHLQRTHLDELGNSIYTNSIERTLQRKVAQWQALNGKPKDVMFAQNHIPGQQALSDFTHFKDSKITIHGKPFIHMLYHFRLVYSKWSYIKVIQSGESMQALSEGLQEALFALGGTPKEHRTDSLSAAFKNIAVDTKKDLTDKYEELCSYYNMSPTRNNKGQKHENGSVESSHGHIKNRIRQELILRGSYDFDSVNEYEQWLQNIIKEINKRNCYDFDTEKIALQNLPKFKTEDYEVKSAKVTNLCIIVVKGIRYSVPSRLSGHTLTLHIYQNEIKAYLGSSIAYIFNRKYQGSKSITYVIDYKHTIHSLIKKPAAFRGCKYRDDILPNENYRLIWLHLDNSEKRNVAPKMMLRLLKLSADHNCEHDLGKHVIKLIQNKIPINIDDIEVKFNKGNPMLPNIECKQHNITNYDFLIKKTIGAQHAAI